MTASLHLPDGKNAGEHYGRGIIPWLENTITVGWLMGTGGRDEENGEDELPRFRTETEVSGCPVELTCSQNDDAFLGMHRAYRPRLRGYASACTAHVSVHRGCGEEGD